MYLEIKPQIINSFSNFFLFLAHKLKIDYPEEYSSIIPKIFKITTESELVDFLETYYVGITYQKVNFSFSDLPLVLMWVDTELNLPKIYARMKWEREYKEHMKNEKLKAIKEAQLQAKKESNEIKEQKKQGRIIKNEL